MSYIGSQQGLAAPKLLDAISVVNGQAAYSLTKNSVAYKPASSLSLQVSLNGIIQAPESSYTISGSTITFASGLVTGDVIDYILDREPTTGTMVPADGSVTTAKIGSGAVTATKVDPTLHLSTIKDSTGTTTAMTIDSSGRVTKGTGGQLPAFLAYPSTNFYSSVGQKNVSNDSNLIYASVNYNYGSHYNTSTGRFVAPVTGLYHFWSIMAIDNNSNTYSYMSAEIHYWSGNGSSVNRWVGGWGSKQNSNTAYDRHYYSIAIPLTAGDGVSTGYEMATANVPVLGGNDGIMSSFGGYLIG